jgi:hypothetical protein
MRVSLSDSQRKQIARAAASLAPAAREVFISDVTATIETRCGGKVPSDVDVNVAISSVLSASPFWPRSVLLCDSNTKEATMTRSDQQDDENFETLPSGQRVLRDKGRASFRMAAMDSADAAQRAAAERHYARRFGLRDAADLRRPGFRLQPDATARDAKLQAYDAYEKHLATAYLSPHAENTGVGSQGPRETRSVGDRCLIQGQNGHLYEADDGSLICVPDQWGDAALDDRAIEHARYIDHITNAWRHPDGDAVPDGGPVQRADAALTRDELYAAYDREIAAAYRNVKP